MEKNKISGDRRIHIILAVIIFLQAALVTWFFAFVKGGEHSDEPWSFGLANSYYSPFIYGTEDADSHERIINTDKFNVVLDGDYFLNYLTVQKGERFSYDSVWYNQTHDTLPPLYYCILHTICSLFPDKFSWWFAYIINFVAMIVGQIFYFKAASRICGSKVTGLLAVIMWGFCYGFISMNVFLRMYSLQIMFGVMFIYYHSRLYNNEGSSRENLIKLGIVTLCGALTHHYFLVAAFGIAACFCFYYLFKKQIKMLFSYAASVAGAVVVSFVVFPASFYHLFVNEIFYIGEDSRNVFEMPFFNGLRYCMSILLNLISGPKIWITSSGMYAYFLAAFVILAAIFVPLAVLFRKEEWFRAFMKKIKDGLRYLVKNIDLWFFFLAVSSLFVIIITVKTVVITLMQGFTDRYLSVVLPWAVLCIILAAKYLIQLIKPLRNHSNKIIAVLVCATVLGSNIMSDQRYIFPRDIDGAGGIETTVSDNSNYVVLLSQNWHMVCYADKLMGCNKAIFTLFYEYNLNKDKLRQIDPEECYIIMNDSAMTEFFKPLDELETSSSIGIVDNGNAENKNDDFSKQLSDSGINSVEDVIMDFETDIFPGYKLEFYSSEDLFGQGIKTYKLVPENEYEFDRETDDMMQHNNNN